MAPEKIFSSELLLTKMEALQEQNTALLQSSKKLQEYVQATEAENRRLVRDYEKANDEREQMARVASAIGMGLPIVLLLAAMYLFFVSSEKNQLEARSKGLAVSARHLRHENRALSKQVAAENRRLEQALFEAKRAKAEMNAALEEKIYLEDILIHNNREIQSLKNAMKERPVDLGLINVAAKPQEPASESSESLSAPEPRRIPKKEGRIRAVNEEHGFVVVDLGRVDNLRENATLYVKRNGDTVATLTVNETRDALSACNIQDITPGYRIQINDVVSR